MEKGNFMNIIYVGLLSFLVFSSLEIMSDINLMAIDLTEIHHNMSLLSLGTDNGSQVFVLHGATLIDGTGSAPKITFSSLVKDILNTVIVIVMISF